MLLSYVEDFSSSYGMYMSERPNPELIFALGHLNWRVNPSQ